MKPIVAEDITRRHRNGRGIDGVSLSVEAGQCFAVLGSNGSGKTTLTRLIGGIDRPDAGALSVLGSDISSRSVERLRRCGVSLDNPAHWETLSGRDNLSFFAAQYGLKGGDLTRRVEELLLLADLGSQADEPVSAYSFGMRRKLSIIEAMVHDPELLLLDEPSAGVDTAFAGKLADEIAGRGRRGKTTWIADNDAEWVARVAGQVILLCDGRVTAGGDVSELKAWVGGRSRIELTLEQADFYAKPDLDGVLSCECKDGQLSIETGDDPQMPVRLLEWVASQGGRVRAMEIHSVTLEQALRRQAEQEGRL